MEKGYKFCTVIVEKKKTEKKERKILVTKKFIDKASVCFYCFRSLPTTTEYTTLVVNATLESRKSIALTSSPSS